MTSKAVPAQPQPGLARRIVGVWAEEFETARRWPRGWWHLARRAILVNVVDALALLVIGRIFPGVDVGGFPGALAVTLIVTALTFLLRPVAFLVLPQSIAVTAFLTFILSTLTLLVAAAIVPDVRIAGPITAFFVGVGIAALNGVALGILGLDEDESFFRNSLKRLARSRGDVDERPGAGFVVIQVDGLAAPVIRSALRTGRMPFLAGWLRSGSHRFGTWEAQAPSMTSAAQAGILHGNNAGIPAFRWFEKERGHLMVSNRPDDAAEIERRARGPKDLLRDGGTSISNLLSGGAARSIVTTSVVMTAGRDRRLDAFALYLVNPYNVTRGIVAFVSTLVVEYFEARQQRVRGIEPRISRGMPFPFLRAAMTTVFRDLLTDLVIGEMHRGCPIVYADYLGYDEIAHHAGPERPEAMAELERVDRQVRTLAMAAEDAPRRYLFIVLSDHGQSQGAPFAQRYGESLEDLIGRLMRGPVSTLAATQNVESWGPLNTFLAELLRTPGVLARTIGRAVRSRRANGQVALGPKTGRSESAAGSLDRDTPRLIVCASGNLANVYFTETTERMTRERIEASHPGLLAGLAQHEGIGFVLVRSESDGALALGPAGTHYLDQGRVEGDDPLAAFGPHAADNLRRLDSFEHVGDVLVNSAYDPESSEIAPFEHQVGAHGGLGGPQTEAFLIYPAELEPDAPPLELVGAEAVNAKLHEWLATARRAGVTQPDAG